MRDMSRNKGKGFIPFDNLVHRNVYSVVSRNLVCGVWDETCGGFIGIREKFGDAYLFTEYEYSVSETFGTARAVKDLGLKIDEDVPLVSTVRVFDNSNGRAVIFVNSNLAEEKGWRYVDDSTPVEDLSYIMSEANVELFNILKPLDDSLRRI